MIFDKTYEKYHIIMRNKYGWTLRQNDRVKVWFCGYQYNNSVDSMFDTISSMLQNTASIQDVLYWVKNISGHFAIVVETSKWTVAAVDKICTIPIFIATYKNDIFISNYAPILKKECSIGKDDLDLLAGLEISMSGFTIGSKTLYRDLEVLQGGEYLLCNKDSLFRDYYYTYSPWKTSVRSLCELKKEFTDICINTLTDLKNSANGRQIVIPLSAGNDSRLIASGLKEIGVKNVICFSYGRKGNFETPISKEIAKSLGYKWLYLPISIKDKRNFFKSNVYQKYVAEFESYESIPNVQEIYEVSLLKNNPLVNDDAIIVNGNSGDFISGGHISSISDVEHISNESGRINWRKFLDKHYSLWRGLRTSANDASIVSELDFLLSSRITESVDFEKYHYAIMESFECIGRQSRIVARQQRAYEYFGYEWRLPLWSDKMVNFWEGVPYDYKIGQGLYIETLHENNWGNVWSDIKVNDKKINPFFLRYIRMLLKIIFIPIGKSKWHRFEKNVLEYFIHPSNALTVVSYLKILFDSRGYRNTNSWLSCEMLKNNGLKDCSNIEK